MTYLRLMRLAYTAAPLLYDAIRSGGRAAAAPRSRAGHATVRMTLITHVHQSTIQLEAWTRRAWQLASFNVSNSPGF